MTVHLQKLCVAIESIEQLAERQSLRLKREGEIVHRTRMAPRRRDEIVDGGSIYWVIKGRVQARQKIRDIEILAVSGTGKRCKIVLDAELVPVRPRPKRAFQGWRYLETADAPPDLQRSAAAANLPERMRAELAELGLI